MPHFADERLLDGSRLGPAASAHAALAARVAKPELPYTAPAEPCLEAVDKEVTLTLSASPDTGWPTLRLPYRHNRIPDSRVV